MLIYDLLLTLISDLTLRSHLVFLISDITSTRFLTVKNDLTPVNISDLRCTDIKMILNTDISLDTMISDLTQRSDLLMFIYDLQTDINMILNTNV